MTDLYSYLMVAKEEAKRKAEEAKQGSTMESVTTLIAIHKELGKYLTQIALYQAKVSATNIAELMSIQKEQNKLIK